MPAFCVDVRKFLSNRLMACVSVQLFTQLLFVGSSSEESGEDGRDDCLKDLKGRVGFVDDCFR